MKKLVIKKNDRTYILDTWSIKVDLDKKERFYSVITGMDNNGMFYQMKVDKIIKPEEAFTEVYLKIN